MPAGVRGHNGGDKTPANVATAEWLVKNGVGKDAGEAWGLLTSGKSKEPVEMQARTASVILNANPRLRPEEAFAQARQLLEGAAGVAPPPSPGPAPAPSSGCKLPGWWAGVGSEREPHGAYHLDEGAALPSGTVYTDTNGVRRAKQ